MPISIKDIPKSVKELLELKRKERGFIISVPEFLALYVHAYNLAEKYGYPDPEVEALSILDKVDPSLTYDELKTEVEAYLMPVSTPAELEELEYWKKRAEELEREIEKLRTRIPEEEIRKLEEQIEEWKRRYEEVKAMYEKVKKTPGLTEEDVARITREVIKPITRALGKELEYAFTMIRENQRVLMDSLTELSKRIEELEKRAAISVELPPEITEAVTEALRMPYAPEPYMEMRPCARCGKEVPMLDRHSTLVIAKILPFPGEYWLYCDECRAKYLGLLPPERYLQDLLNPKKINISPIPPEYYEWLVKVTVLLKKTKGETWTP